MPRIAHHSLSAQNRQVRGLVAEMRAGELSVATPYQRESVWTDDQRVALIESWLRGVPLPAIILNNRNSLEWRQANPNRQLGVDPVSVVIDGRQRLETAQMFLNGNLHVPAEWFTAEEIADLGNLWLDMTVTFNDLTRSAQLKLASMMLIPVAEANVTTLEEEAAVYLLVNSAGTSQTADDLARAARVATGKGA